MPIIALTKPTAMPVGIMRTQLQAGLPLWQFRCGDDDQGGATDSASFQRTQTIMARSSDGIVLMSIEERDEPLPAEAGAPPHQRHLSLSQPSTEDSELAERMVMIASACIAEQDPGAHCQITADGPWYSAAQMVSALAFCTTSAFAGLSVEEYLRNEAEALSVLSERPSVASAAAPSAEDCSSRPEVPSGGDTVFQPSPAHQANSAPVAFGRPPVGFGRRGL